MATNLEWRSYHFDEISKRQLLALLALRAQVFVIEQQSIYQDIDGHDPFCHHLMATHEDLLVAYARLAPPGVCHQYAVLGRVVLEPTWRGRKVGRQLIGRALDELSLRYPGKPIKISAQLALEDYYADFGFISKGEPYDDGGVLHIDMLLAP